MPVILYIGWEHNVNKSHAIQKSNGSFYFLFEKNAKEKRVIISWFAVAQVDNWNQKIAIAFQNIMIYL